MRMLEWLRNGLSVRYRSLWTYRRGMSRATRHDHQGALEDYTTVIESNETPSELKAMALYSRALVHSAQTQDGLASKDLEEVLNMTDAKEAVKTEAKRKIVRMQRASDKNVSQTSPNEPVSQSNADSCDRQNVSENHD